MRIRGPGSPSIDLRRDPRMETQMSDTDDIICEMKIVSVKRKHGGVQQMLFHFSLNRNLGIECGKRNRFGDREILS